MIEMRSVLQKRWLHLFLFFGILLINSTEQIFGQWSNDPRANTPLSVWQGERYVEDLLSDGKGGAFLVWGDYSNYAPGVRVFCQRVSSRGEILWPESGVRVSLTSQTQETPKICGDGADGIIVTWSDGRFNSSDIFAQRLGPTGDRLWGDDGVAISTAFQVQMFPGIAPDGMGGALIVWRDLRYQIAGDIFSQRVNANGVVQWTSDGVAVCALSGTQGDPDIISDSQGGAFIVWYDDRPGNIYLQHLGAGGDALWTPNGIRDCPGSSFGGDDPKLISDQASGCIVISNQGRAQRLNSAGDRLWGLNGVQALTVNGIQPQLVGDSAGGAIICTSPYVGGGRTDVYVQRVAANGSLPWGSSSTPVCTTHTSDLNDARLCTDGKGGAIITWGDLRNDSIDVYAQHVDSSGMARWAANGVPVSLASKDQQSPFAVPDMKGGAILSWCNDTRHGDEPFAYYYDIYAQNIDRYGFLGVPAPVITSIIDHPSDQGGLVKISWKPSYLDRDTSPVVSRYAIFRMNDSSSSYQWLSTVSASSETSYTQLVPTLTDSNAEGISSERFLVQALSADSSMHWDSEPESGYSADNLAPVAVASLTGALQPDSNVSLHWNPNIIDQDIRGYAVYRAESTNVLIPPVKIALVIDTSFVDSLYRLGSKTAYFVIIEDSNDNNSPPSPPIIVSSTRTYSYSVQTPGWQLLSVPISLVDYRKETLFPMTSGAGAFRYEKGYSSTDSLLPSYGYWLKFIGTDTIPITGSFRARDTVFVKKGWNIIGSLSEPIPTGMISSMPPEIATSSFYSYTAAVGYSVVDSLLPGKGFWVKVSQDAKLILSTPSEQSITNRAHITIQPTSELPPPSPDASSDGGDTRTYEKPFTFELLQNAPNPFNPTTKIGYSLVDQGRVSLKVYNTFGQQVANLVDAVQSTGFHEVVFDGSNLSTGIYFYRIQASNYSAVKKLMLLK
jgi:hypothetical protein